MLFVSLVRHYFLWHYSRAFSEIFHVWLNFLWFVVHLFSIPQLIRSLLSPWKRITEERQRRWNFEDFIGVVIIGLLSRTVGFLVRSVIIITGFVFLKLTVVLGFIFFTAWVVMPVLIIALIIFGVTLIAA